MLLQLYAGLRMHTVPWQLVPQGFSHASEVVGRWRDSLRDGTCGASLGEYQL